MIYDLTRDALAGYAETAFAVLDAPAAPLTVHLRQVTPLQRTRRQEMFSLMFQGPADRFLPQNMYQIKHDQLGEFFLLLVPVGKDEQGYTYQAVFNHLIKS